MDVRSQAVLAYYERGSGVTTELVNNTAYATLTKNPNQPNGQSFVLSLYNYDPCAYEAVHGAHTMPSEGMKMEAFVSGRQGYGTAWLSGDPTALNQATLAQARLVKAQGTTCTVDQRPAASGEITMTGFTTGGSGKSLPKGIGKISARFTAGNPTVLSTASNLIFGRFTPAMCSPMSPATSPGAPGTYPCSDTNNLRQVSLF